VINSTESTSTRPYLIRALHEWCIDNGFTPLITVHVDANTQVPKEHVKDKEIVLNLSFDATSGLKLGNDYIEFKARFSGVARDIVVPINRVVAIYAREKSTSLKTPTPPLQCKRTKLHLLQPPHNGRNVENRNRYTKKISNREHKREIK